MPEFTKYDVELWIKAATGEFHYKQVLDGRVSPSSYGKLRAYITDYAKKGLIEPCGRRDGYYRTVEDLPMPVDWQKANSHRDFPVELPFELRKYVFIYPNTVIVVAGAKSAGKTGFLYRTVAMNMNEINTVLLSNLEGGREQMRDRFDAMDIEVPNPSPFKVYNVTENFQDAIREPNTLYVVDYIDAPEGADFYLIGAAISKIRKKLDNSVAVIGLQKPSFRDTAFGGEQTLKEAALYLAMDTSKLKIVDAKVPADRTIHPKNMSFSFAYDDDGTRFTNITKSHF